MNDAAILDVKGILPDCHVERRYIPFVAVHEFEALLFSDAAILSKELGIDVALVNDVLERCGSPEQINNHPETSPSRRLLDWTNGHYGKATRGIVLARQIGIDRMRAQCPNFHAWLSRLESLAGC